MSASERNTRHTPYQPFQCNVCQRRFTRQENLKRHAALHSRSSEEASLVCNICQTTFSRHDLHQRHMKRQHSGYREQKSTSRQQISRSTSEQDMILDQPRTEMTSLTSPTDSSRSLYSQQPEVRIEANLGIETWNPSAPHEQAHGYLNQSAYYEGHPDQGPSIPMIAEEDDTGVATSLSSDYTFMSQSTSAGHIRQNTAGLHHNQPLEQQYQESARLHGISAHNPATSPSNTFNSSPNNMEFSPRSLDKLWSNETPQFQDDWSPSALQRTIGLDLFFTHVSSFVPFLHRPTVTYGRVPHHLLLSILCLAYQYGEDPDCNEQVDSGQSLSVNCFYRARALLKSTDEDEDAVDLPNSLSMVQACLLLEIGATMYFCGKFSAYGLKLHSRMISFTRAASIMQPKASESSKTKDLDSLWQDFIETETLKRTAFAVHQIDALWYQLMSVPRSISHLEIKHDLPCPADHWQASSAAEWAYQRLATGNSTASMPYADVIRHILSGSSDTNILPAFDPYGAINVTQFLISSAREASGWATISGMLSLERLEPLRKSLIALKPFTQSNNDNTETSQTTVCEATWETAMIELQMWSLSHTGGIVESSIDAVVRQSTYLASSCESLCDSNTAKMLKPHVDWFLRYLDAETIPASEAPWVLLYAYKAFLIAWQLLREGITGAMQAVGVPDGDLPSALSWARTVFQRRQRWQLSRLITAELDQLDTSK